MWNSWKNWLLSLSCIALAAACGLVAVRHRHTGDQAHSHSRRVPVRSEHTHRHPHPHSHTHDHGHAHPHHHSHAHRVPGAETARNRPETTGWTRQFEGWHVHLFLFGYEITLWEQGLDIARVPSFAANASSDVPMGTMVLRGLEVLTPGGQIGTVIALTWLLICTLLRRVRCPTGDYFGTVVLEGFILPRGRERPPLPPPRMTQTRFILFECR